MDMVGYYPHLNFSMVFVELEDKKNKKIAMSKELEKKVKLKN